MGKYSHIKIQATLLTNLHAIQTTSSTTIKTPNTQQTSNQLHTKQQAKQMQANNKQASKAIMPNKPNPKLNNKSARINQTQTNKYSQIAIKSQSNLQPN